VKYDAAVFDLLTALIDSWTLWNDVAGSADKGMKWRRRYLEITYGCGAYRPYETLVREAARDTGFPESFGAELERRWGELKPWPEAPGVLRKIPVPLAVATNCSVHKGEQAAALVGVPFKLVETAESVRSGLCSWRARRRMCRAPRRSACRCTGTIVSDCRPATTPSRISWRTASNRWLACFKVGP